MDKGGGIEALVAKPRPLLQLLRPPNLFTVPGDPLCGALVASHGEWSWRIVPGVLISLAAYCAGLVINDLADYREDLRDRPGRPLPSGAVSKRTAGILAASFGIVAMITASCVNGLTLILTLLLLAEICFYNLFAKKIGFLAPLAMGLCRGLSVLVGAAAVNPFRAGVVPVQGWPLLAACIILLYIAAVTALARNETASPRIPPLIGALIRGLLFIQAGFCALAGGAGYAAAILLLALWPVSRLVARRYYAS